MSDAPRPRKDPHDLILAHLEGDLTSQEFATLNDLLRARPEVRAMYRDLVDRSAALRSTLRAADSDLKPGGARVPGRKPQSAPQQSSPNSRKRPQPKPIPFIIYPIAIAAAALLTAAIVVVYLLAFTTDPQPDPIKPDRPGPPVATLIESTGGKLTTPHGFPVEGDDFSAGEYTLTSGGAEFMLTNAVNVKLRGDTRLFMRNDMNVSLMQGNAAFVVPPNAIGFAVHLPGGVRVIDLGTAFVIDQSAEGPTTIRVIDGAVRVDTGDNSNLLEVGILLTLVDGVVFASSTVDDLRSLPLANVALGKVATQSSDHYPGQPGPTVFPAANAVDGDVNTFTSTRGMSRPIGTEPDLTPSWQVDLAGDRAIHRVVLHNRRGIAPWRLRDVRVAILSDDGKSVVYRSDLLNPNNELDGPPSITLDLIDDHGLPVRGRFVRITRRYDEHNRAGSPDTSIDDLVALSLSEVEVYAETDALSIDADRSVSTNPHQEQSTSDTVSPTTLSPQPSLLENQ